MFGGYKYQILWELILDLNWQLNDNCSSYFVEANRRKSKLTLHDTVYISIYDTLYRRLDKIKLDLVWRGIEIGVWNLKCEIWNLNLILKYIPIRVFAKAVLRLSNYEKRKRKNCRIFFGNMICENGIHIFSFFRPKKRKTKKIPNQNYWDLILESNLEIWNFNSNLKVVAIANTLLYKEWPQ